MALSPRLSAADLDGAGLRGEGKRPFDFLVTEATLYRSRGVITIPQGTRLLVPGDFITAAGEPATAPADIFGIVCYYVATEDGHRDAVIICRDAEVRDAFLMYRGMDAGEVAAQLETRGIIVRAAVLAQSMQMGFDTPGEPVQPISGTAAAIPASGIPNDDPQAGPPVRREGEQGSD